MPRAARDVKTSIIKRQDRNERPPNSARLICKTAIKNVRKIAAGIINQKMCLDWRWFPLHFPGKNIIDTKFNIPYIPQSSEDSFKTDWKGGLL
jgi:hypothetical protein